MFEILKRLRMARAMGRLIEDPTQTDEVFKLARLGRTSKETGPVQALIRAVSKQTEFMALFESGYLPRLPALAELKTYAPGTLGAAYHKHLASNNLQPDFFPPEPVDGILSYMILRLRQTHDLWHVLLGFDTSVAGEIGVQGFSLAQVRSPLSVLLLFGGMLHLALKHPDEVPHAMDQLVDGYTRGKKARFLLAVRWEEMLGDSLVNARHVAGLN